MPPERETDHALAQALRAARERAGRSQERVAYEAGMTVGTIARIEQARTNPTWSTIRRICRVLGLSMAELGRAVDEHE